MCLSIAVRHPDLVLGRGEHAGHQWMVVHNSLGFRCGYVRVPASHPWHSAAYNEIEARVHGGLTFAEPDLPCDKPGADDAYWVGFDCAHLDDLPDPELPRDSRLPSVNDTLGGHAWTQAEVEAECRSLCDQAATAASRVTAGA